MNDGWWMRLFWLTHSWVLLLIKLRHINCIAWCFLCPMSGEGVWTSFLWSSLVRHPPASFKAGSVSWQCNQSFRVMTTLPQMLESCTWLKCPSLVVPYPITWGFAAHEGTTEHLGWSALWLLGSRQLSFRTIHSCNVFQVGWEAVNIAKVKKS